MGARESRHDPGTEVEPAVADYYALLEVEETATADEIKACEMCRVCEVVFIFEFRNPFANLL